MMDSFTQVGQGSGWNGVQCMEGTVKHEVQAGLGDEAARPVAWRSPNLLPCSPLFLGSKPDCMCTWLHPVHTIAHACDPTAHSCHPAPFPLRRGPAQLMSKGYIASTEKIRDRLLITEWELNRNSVAMRR